MVANSLGGIKMIKSKRGCTRAWVFKVSVSTVAVLGLGLWVGWVYVLIHFISKYW